MRCTGFLAVLLWIASTSAFAQATSSQQANSQQSSVAQGTQPQTIQGCLTGKPDSYWLRERDGTEHALIGDRRELSAHVGQSVQLAGQRDENRDASASSDEATAHGLRFFQVWGVTQMQGNCRR